MSTLPTSFRVDQLYSSDEIQGALQVGNAGGVRLSLHDSGLPRRIVIMTSPSTSRQAAENPYHDRIEGDTLVYTGAGREGDQSLAGVNQRIPQQLVHLFPIYGFEIIGSRRDATIGPKRWKFLGLLQYLRHYPEMQVDVRLQQRRVWIFEMRVHKSPVDVPVFNDASLFAELLAVALLQQPNEPGDREIALPGGNVGGISQSDAVLIESIRAQLLGVNPQRFEHVVREALQHSGFQSVVVTRFSQDGGIDVNAVAGPAMWPLRDLLIQLQAKRWLHTVGRKEVAELRGSLQPFARGAVVTTSHYSRAAIAEASEAGKNPIVLVDGFAFASLIHDLKIVV